MAHSPQATPTVDYYFMAAAAPQVASGATPEPSRPIVRLGPYTFAHARRAVVFRYITPDELGRLRALDLERVYYLVDDLLPLAHACLELPAVYRRRLAQFTRIFPASNPGPQSKDHCAQQCHPRLVSRSPARISRPGFP